ncbi:uncharacterized protein LOC115319050 [Ixodes scapularis]|uniref:uncharacterized protein LOC115319050 n=1 Tax=Ixodes scapularis TaxID=6945 RepID=UPI001A9F4358|nr:uncharacterized protein LOC115319050 [Ixodes scapularis]
MASSASTSTASIEPAVPTNWTGDKAKSSTAAPQALDTPMVPTMKTDIGLKATHGGCGFTFSSRTSQLFRWRCDNSNCRAMLKTGLLNGQHYLIHFVPHDEEVHRRGSPCPPGGGAQTPCTPRDGPKRKADSCADKPRETVNGDAQVPAKKSTGLWQGRPQDNACPAHRQGRRWPWLLAGQRLPIARAGVGRAGVASAGVARAGVGVSHTAHKQGTPPGKAEDAAGDKIKIESAKGSGAGNLVDGRAAAVQHSPVHSQHLRGSNEPGTSASPSGDHEAKESKILPPPTPPGRANHGITVKNPKSHKSMNRDIKEKSGAVKQEADDVNSRDVKAGGKGSLDPPLRIASYESMRNGWNAADDSAGIALSMQGLGRTQIILNMNLETGDLCDKDLRERLLRLLQAEHDFVVQQQKSEVLRIELLSKELYSNMTDNKI